MKTDSLGSIWRRWDLHFHTPASFDYQDRSVNSQRLVDKLISEGIEVVAVTDHHVIDVKLIKEMQALAGDRLTVLLESNYALNLVAANPFTTLVFLVMTAL